MAQPLFTGDAGETRNDRPALRSVPAPARELKRPSALHLHWFRWSGEDAFSGSSLYTCRCGQARSSL
ncbi:hypothetical protein [Blastococcus sp. TF02-8]|uniref:hypothetical protein n=1 Tax=Blastococcus sp. TF02-8 TaxID=2250574 RepID=UPI0011BEDC7F|nr:hypothetical protein [Blastococcus sp. TF02-8]